MIQHSILPAAIAACAMATLPCAGQATEAAPKALPLAELKAFYLDCDRLAMTRLLAPGEAAICSTAYEELKQRAFNGDFARLLAWYRAQSLSNSATR